MTPFVFGVLTCVSLEDQASEDKDSLNFQLRTARAYGEKWGGTFTREYRADGFSRSGFWDLSQVFQAEPESFGALAQDARAHRFDVVMVESYDRLGDLGIALFNFFQSLGTPYIQIVSVQQRIMIEDPKAYHPRRDDSIPNALAESLKVNKYRTNKNFRAFELGNTARARSGRHGNTFPYAYLKHDTGVRNKRGNPIYDLILDEPVADLLRKFPAWFLSGATYPTIARRADESGIPPPRAEKWDPGHIKYMLSDPFYAGKVFYGKSEKISNGHYRDKDQYDLYDGAHPPLWSWETHERIQAEIKRRSRHKAKATDYNFTSLLKCSECGDALVVTYSSYNPKNKYWRCLGCGKVKLKMDEANRAVAGELRRLFAGRQYAPTPDDEIKDTTRREIAKIETQMRRDKDAYDAGAYSPQEYAELRQSRKTRLEELKNERMQTEIVNRSRSERERLLTTMQDVLPFVDAWLVRDARTANYHLSRIVALTVYPDRTIKGELLGVLNSWG